MSGNIEFEGYIVPQLYRKEFLETIPKNGVCAELGVKVGDFSKQIIDITKPKEIRLIDKWDKRNTFHVFLGNILPYIKKSDTCIRFLRATTQEAYTKKFLKSNYFDWVYIDADHSGPAVKQDLIMALDIVKCGGLITGDDYDEQEYPQLVNVVNTFAKQGRVMVHMLGNKRQYIMEKIC